MNERVSLTTWTRNLMGNPPYVPPSRLSNLPVNVDPLKRGSLSWEAQKRGNCHLKYIYFLWHVLGNYETFKWPHLYHWGHLHILKKSFLWDGMSNQIFISWIVNISYLKHVIIYNMILPLIDLYEFWGILK